MKTLLVHYTPRNAQSSTKKLLDAFRAGIKNSAVEELSLTRDSPDLFLEENLSAYIQRNYLGQDLDPSQRQAIAKMDRMTDQLISADVVVVAYPMYNFSMPASVKAWFDSVMLKGRTWEVRDGRYMGLMKDKKALVLVASGGFYGKEPMASWEHALSLGKLEFQFMGYSDIRGILAQGMNSGDSESGLKASVAEAQNIASEWYGNGA